MLKRYLVKTTFVRFIFLLLFTGISINSMGQIDLMDTTAVVIAHWKMNDAQKYRVTSRINSTEENKIISSETIGYDVSIKVIDSTQVGYILEWTRSNFQITTDDALDKSIIKITEDIPLWITTDEFGSSLQVLNWEDVGNSIKERGEKLKEEYKEAPDKLIQINRMVRQSSSKEMIVDNMILDAQQMLAFHGAKYKYDERIDLQVKVPNNYGGDPLDANMTLLMDKVDLKLGTFIIRSSQRINPQQLTAVTYDYLSSLNFVDGQMPPYEEFPLITKLIWGGNEIHGNSGWVIYSVETKQTTNDKMVTVEERTIVHVPKA